MLGNGTVMDLMGWYAWKIFFETNDAIIPQAVDEIRVKVLFLWTLQWKGEVWMMKSEQCELSLCREMCNFSIFLYVCGYVTIMYYQDEYLWSVIQDDELEIYDIVSYSSLLVFCCSAAKSVSSNVFDIKLLSCCKFWIYRWH